MGFCLFAGGTIDAKRRSVIGVQGVVLFLSREHARLVVSGCRPRGDKRLTGMLRSLDHGVSYPSPL